MVEVTTTEAARILSTEVNGELKPCHPDTVRMYAKLGYLKATTRSGNTGRAQRMYFDKAEVEAFKAGGEPAARAYREARDLKVMPKRGRKVGAR